MKYWLNSVFGILFSIVIVYSTTGYGLVSHMCACEDDKKIQIAMGMESNCCDHNEQQPISCSPANENEECCNHETEKKSDN